MKNHLRALIARTRGASAFPLVSAAIEKMTEPEAEQWYRLLQNLKDDAVHDGERSVRRRFGMGSL